ncbi:MAG: HYR domain-containing protein [Bacteroidetes bacterium]|nr:HYR domain-containing protein [Bacteroidota bacterium]
MELILVSQASDGTEPTASLLNIKYVQSFYDATSRIYFSVSQNTEDKNYQSHRLEFDQWCHLAFTFDGEWAYAYLNGKLIGQMLILKSLRSNNQPLLLGRDAVMPKFYQGAMDDVRFYDRALLPGEINTLYTDNTAKQGAEVFKMKVSDDLKVSSDKGKCSATLKFFPPVVTLSCGGYEVKQVSGIPSGSLFNVGKTYNRFQATADDGRIITETFTVEVVDAQNPDLQCPADVYVQAPAAAKVMPVRYPGVVATDNCVVKSVEKVKGLASGAYFPIGTTEIRYQVSDSAGNRSDCGFKVVVTQEAPPAPAPVEQAETKPVTVQAPAPATQVTEKPTPTPLPTPVVVKNDPAPTAKSDKKDTVVQRTSSNAPDVLNKNVTPATTVIKSTEPSVSAVKTQPGVVVSEVKPKPNQVEVFGDGVPTKSKIVFPSDMTKPSEPGKCGATVTYKAPKSENGKEITVQQSKGKTSGSFFPVGVTENAFYAIQQSGSTEYFFNVVVTDNELPVIRNCPRDTVVKLPYGRRGVNFYYDKPIISDNCKADTLSVITGSVSGCFLPLGVHPFLLEARDASGNATQCGFEVVVMEDAVPSIVTAPQKLSKHLNLGTDSINYEHKVDVNNCFLTILIYDDGEEDNDSVSIIFNGSVIVNRDMIRLKENGAIKRELVLGSSMQNYLIAKAWNTGRYGSNTLRIDVYEGLIENEKKDLKNKKPVISKILHSRPGIAGGVLLNCKQ